jgi:hypothetical protein
MEVNNNTKWNPIQQKIGRMEKWYVQPHNVGSGDEITMNPYISPILNGIIFLKALFIHFALTITFPPLHN